MERFFNTAGPNVAEDSYTLDPLKRFDLDDILTLIRKKRYFVLHAPRQTGKTSCMLALRDYLNAVGDYRPFQRQHGKNAFGTKPMSVMVELSWYGWGI